MASAGEREGPGGDWRTASYEALAADATGALRFLRERDDVDGSRVGLWGLSEGEWVAPLAAERTSPAFLVLVSPSAMTPSEQVRYKTRSNVLRAGYGEAAAERAAELYGRISEFQRTGAGREELNRLLAAFARGGNDRFTGLLSPSAVHGVIVWTLPGLLPPPWFAKGYLDDQIGWVRRAAGLVGR